MSWSTWGSVLLPLLGDAVIALGRAFWQHQGRGLILSPWGHPNTGGCTNAQTELSQPQEREAVRKEPCITWKCKVFRREREGAKIAGFSQGVPCSSLVIWGGCLKGKEVVLL